MNEKWITGSIGKGGHSFLKFSEDLIIFLSKIEQLKDKLKDKQSNNEMYKNIHGKWSRPCTSQLIIGELGRGMSYYKKLK